MRTLRRLIVPGAMLATIGFAFLLPAMAERSDRQEPREIVLVARDMAFFAEGKNLVAEPNPPIHLSPGEVVTLILRNEEAGMTHDFAITKWSTATKALKEGDVDRITFTAPEKPGTFEYVCRPHSLMMRGLVIVE